MGRGASVVVLSLVAAGAGCTLVTDLSGFTGPDATPDGGAEASDVTTVPGTLDSGGSAYASAVLADEPIAYYRLDEASGTIAKDASGHGRDGAMLGTVQWGVDGAVGDGGHAVHFDGVSSALDLGTAFDFAGRAPFTLEMWVFEEGIDSEFRHLFTKDFHPSGARQEYGMFYYDGEIALERYVDDDGMSCSKARKDLVGRWAHVAGTYDGDALRVYVDGQPVGSTDDTRSQPSKDTHFFVGAKTDDGDGVVNGSIDEVAIYDKALSPARVAAHFAAAGK